MSSFLEQYGKALFTLVLVAILIAFSGPLGTKIKEYIVEKVSQTEQIGCDEIASTTNGIVRPDEPTETVDETYCIYYSDGELVIAQNQITPESNRTVVKKGFYNRPIDCTQQMTTVKFEGGLKPKNCENWFYHCANLTEIKNIQNLYTTNCVKMNSMFESCTSLTTLNLSTFDTTNVSNMKNMFQSCSSLTSVGNIADWNINNVQSMFKMFSNTNLSNINICNWNINDNATLTSMFSECSSLQSVKVSQETYNKLITVSNLGISTDKFDIVK